MNINQFDTSPLDQTDHVAAIADGRLTKMLRALGALAIVGSGLIYMLQGLYQSDADLRSWVYIALIATLGLGGVFSSRFMQDAKGARLFFALGTVLVPVQFSQLGGMVLNYFSGDQAIINLFKVAAPQTTTLVWVALLSLISGALVAFAGFSILCRPYAKILCAVFIAMNIALLLPFRELWSAILLVGIFACVLLFLEKRVYRNNPLFNTSEGFSVRLIMLLPVAIVIARGAFHGSEGLGISAVFGCGGLLFLYMARVRSKTSVRASDYWLNELLIFGALAFSLVALPGASYELFAGANAWLPLKSPLLNFAYGVPVFFTLLYFSLHAKAGAVIYRGAAMLVLAATALSSTADPNALSSLLLVLMGVCLATFGFIYRQKISFAIGALMTTGFAIDLAFATLRDISVNLWLFLAVSGLCLVALSSVLERHGKRWLQHSRDYWQEFNEWEAR